MIFKKEYRYVYGVWGYFEDILKELNADIKKEEKGDLREYRAEVDNVTIVGRINMKRGKYQSSAEHLVKYRSQGLK
jgi:hypothetical protein